MSYRLDHMTLCPRDLNAGEPAVNAGSPAFTASHKFTLHPQGHIALNLHASARQKE